jgi:hypothetical protein
MKNIKTLRYFIFGLLFLGCQEDFLQENPTSIIDPAALLTDKAGAEIYTVGAYDAARNALMSNFQTGWLNIWGVMAVDEIVSPGWSKFKPIYLNTVSPSDIIIRDIWENMYVNLNKVNSVIDRVGAMSEDQIDDDDKNKLVAQARFLRAIINFALVCSWENIPLIKNETTSLENLEVPQSTPLDVYKFIEEDLLFVKDNLEAKQGGGRVTRGAAQAVLGRVYLQMTGHPINDPSYFAKAESELKDVIDSGVYDLVDYYPNIFKVDNEQNEEIIFSFGFDGPGMDQGSAVGTLYGPLGSVSNGSANGNMWYVNWELAGPATGPGNTGNWTSSNGKGGLPRNNHAFAQPYEDLDIRSRNNIAKTNVNQSQWINNWPEDGMFGDRGQNIYGQARRLGKGAWKPWKWHNIRPSDWGSDTPVDEIYIRYADVLLMYAEALNGQNKLTQADADMTINLLRARARVWPDEVKTGVAADLVVGTQQHNKDEILSERRKELCFEGWRRNDLVRNGVYYEAINSSQPIWSNSGNPQPQYTPNEIRWPIPASELQINSKLVQNEGYD